MHEEYVAVTKSGSYYLLRIKKRLAGKDTFEMFDLQRDKKFELAARKKGKKGKFDKKFLNTLHKKNKILFFDGEQLMQTSPIVKLFREVEHIEKRGNTEFLVFSGGRSWFHIVIEAHPVMDEFGKHDKYYLFNILRPNEKYNLCAEKRPSLVPPVEGKKYPFDPQFFKTLNINKGMRGIDYTDHKGDWYRTPVTKKFFDFVER